MSELAVHPLVTALAEGVRLLEAGEAEEAARVLRGATALCTGPLEPTSIREAKRLLDTCRSAESALRHQVVDQLRQLGATQKAQIYRAR